MLQMNPQVPAHLQFQALVTETLTHPVLDLIFHHKNSVSFEPLLEKLEETTTVVKSSNQFPELMPLRLTRILIYCAQEALRSGIDFWLVLSRLNLDSKCEYRTLSRLLMVALLNSSDTEDKLPTVMNAEAMDTLTKLVGASCDRIRLESNFSIQ